MTNECENRFHFGVYGIIEVDSRLLVVNKARGPYKGLFDLAGGRPEFGESVKEALERGILEEAGLIVKDYSYADDCSFVSKYRDQSGNQVELHHVGLLFFIHSIDQAGYRSSITFEDVQGSMWMRRDLLLQETCSPLLKKALSL